MLGVEYKRPRVLALLYHSVSKILNSKNENSSEISNNSCKVSCKTNAYLLTNELWNPALWIYNCYIRMSMLYAARSGVTRGLSQGENLAERGALVTAGGPLVNTQRQFEKCYWIMIWMSITKTETTGKHSDKRQKTTYWKPKEYSIPKYKQSGGPGFTFSLRGRDGSHTCLPSVTPVATCTESVRCIKRLMPNDVYLLHCNIKSLT